MPLTADTPVRDRQGPGVVVSAAVRGIAGVPERLWFALPAELEGNVAADADPFLPVLMLGAMAYRLPLETPEVSTELLEGCRRVMDIYQAWSASLGDTLARIPITGPTQPRQRTGRAAGAFFSGGVDSTYTLLRNHDRYPPGDARRIQYLVLGHGLDVSLDDQDLFDRVLATSREVADAHGVELIPVRTNVRVFTGTIDWGRYAHGPCLAAVGHVLSPLLHTMYIASSYWFTTLKPWGSHPDIDARWSSERLEFLHHGLEATRADKIRRIARSAIALRTLRVCWRTHGEDFNCGRCEKCLRTMFALSCCGVLDRAATFPPRLDPALVAGLRLKPAELPYWQDNLRLAAECPPDRALAEAARGAVDRACLQHAGEGRGQSAPGRVVLSRAGLKQLDECYFNSALARAMRALRPR